MEIGYPDHPLYLCDHGSVWGYPVLANQGRSTDGSPYGRLHRHLGDYLGGVRLVDQAIERHRLRSECLLVFGGI